MKMWKSEALDSDIQSANAIVDWTSDISTAFVNIFDV